MHPAHVDHGKKDGRPKAGGNVTGQLGGEAKGTTLEHHSWKAGHDRLCLYVEVPIHLIGTPPADEANTVTVDASTQECHGAACLSGAGGDVGEGVCRVRVKVEGRADARGEGVAERWEKGASR